MVAEAKVKITIDRTQARRVLDQTEGGRAPREARIGGAPGVARAGRKASTERNEASTGASGPKAAAKGGGIIKTLRKVALPILAVQQTFQTLLPVLSELIKSGIEESFGSDPFANKVKEVTTSILDNLTDNFQTGLAAGIGTVKTVGEAIQVAKGVALTGQQLEPGQFSDIALALAKVNIFETKVQFDLSEAGVTQATRNAAKAVRGTIREYFDEVFLPGSK